MYPPMIEEAVRTHIERLHQEADEHRMARMAGAKPRRSWRLARRGRD